MKVLLIGGTRFIGKEISNQLKKNGHDVFFFNRGKANLCSQTIQGDVNNLLDFKTQILELNFDVIIHCIAFSPKHGRDLVELTENTKTRLIVLSSCDCYEAFQGINRGVDLSDLPINENSQLSKTEYYWADSQAKAQWDKEYDKNLMTNEVEKSANNWTVFRLPMVYGPGDHQYPGRHGFIIQHILDKKNFILTQMEQSQLFTFGYIKNIVAAMIHSLDNEQSYKKIYNLGDRVTFSKRRWIDLFLAELNIELEIEILPTEVVHGREWANLAPQNLVINNEQYYKDTGFEDPYSLKDAIKETFEYAKENRECLGEDFDYASREKALESYRIFMDQLWK